MCLEELGKWTNIIRSIGYGTRDLLACGVVPKTLRHRVSTAVTQSLTYRHSSHIIIAFSFTQLCGCFAFDSFF
jgi:hypothetical protein